MSQSKSNSSQFLYIHISLNKSRRDFADFAPLKYTPMSLDKYDSNGVLESGTYYNSISSIDNEQFTCKIENGVYHCDEKDEFGHNLPAIVYKNGRKEWWVNGERFRDKGKPMIEFEDGSCMWCKDLTNYTDDTKTFSLKVIRKSTNSVKQKYDDSELGQWFGVSAPLHVIQSESPVHRFYDENDLLHRDPINGVDRPAVIYENGEKEYWNHGKRYYPHVVESMNVN